MAIGAVVSGATSLIETGMGIYDRIKASQISDERPLYDIPGSQEDSLRNAAMLAGMREMPGQSLIEDKLRGSTASANNAIQQQGGGAAAMGAIGDAYANEQGGLTNIAIESANTWRNNQLNYQSQLGQMAGFEDKKWEWDKGKEYEDRMQKKGFLEQSGTNAIMSGLTSAAGTIQGAEDSKWMKDFATGIESDRQKQLTGGGGEDKSVARQGVDKQGPPTIAMQDTPMLSSVAPQPQPQSSFNPYQQPTMQGMWDNQNLSNMTGRYNFGGRTQPSLFGGQMQNQIGLNNQPYSPYLQPSMQGMWNMKR